MTKKKTNSIQEFKKEKVRNMKINVVPIILAAVGYSIFLVRKLSHFLGKFEET